MSKQKTAYKVLAILIYALCCINICHGGKVTDSISDDDAEIFALKVQVAMTKDRQNCGDVSAAIRLKEYDRVTEDGKIFAFASKHMKDDHTAVILYHENEAKHLVFVTVMPIDGSKETYVKAVVPALIYNLLNIGLDMKEVQTLLLKSTIEDMVVVNCKTISKKIVLYKLDHTSGDKIPTYHIMTI